jgi:uncharacterized protein DUF262/Mrr restriction endonuclease-like protein
MALPAEPVLIDALIKSLHRIGRPASISEQEAEVQNLLSLSPEDVQEKHDGERTKLNYRLAWCRTQLKALNIIRAIEKGVWELTAHGQAYKNLAELEEAEPDALSDAFDDAGQIEGLDSRMPEKFGDYPIDTVLIREDRRTVFEVVRRIDLDEPKKSKFIMDPDFQRDFIWNTHKQSKLIESTIMRIPLPVFYLAEREDGKTIVVDGLQRLSTLASFLNNKLALTGLELAKELNGKTFSDLTPKLQNRIEDTQLILYLIDPKVPEQAKLDIFERVNGGVPLTRQQMRNSIYNGSSTRWLKEEARAPDFLQATCHSLDSHAMRDRECINRFCAFYYLGEESYDKGDMDDFLAKVLKEMNSKPAKVLEQLTTLFRKSMRNNYTIFGAYAFRKHWSQVGRRSVINVALFDVFSVLMTQISEETAANSREEISQIFVSLMNDSTFIDSISLGTNSTSKVKTRFNLARAALQRFIQNA